MEDYSDSDTSSESEYESDQGSTTGSDSEEDELSENREPDLSEPMHMTMLYGIHKPVFTTNSSIRIVSLINLSLDIFEINLTIRDS